MSDQKSESVEFELRDVVMADPDLSERTNQLMTADLQVAVGSRTVSVPADRRHVDRIGPEPQPDGHLSGGTDGRLLTGIIVSMCLGVAAILAVGTGHGWIVPLAFVLVTGLALLVVRTVLAMTRTREHPSATTAAALQADGIRNPDEFFSAAVAEFAGTADVEADADEHRVTAVEEDPAQAAAEQEAAMTPSGGPSKAVGL